MMVKLSTTIFPPCWWWCWRCGMWNTTFLRSFCPPCLHHSICINDLMLWNNSVNSTFSQEQKKLNFSIFPVIVHIMLLILLLQVWHHGVLAQVKSPSPKITRYTQFLGLSLNKMDKTTCCCGILKSPHLHVAQLLVHFSS